LLETPDTGKRGAPLKRKKEQRKKGKKLSNKKTRVGRPIPVGAALRCEWGKKKRTSLHGRN